MTEPLWREIGVLTRDNAHAADVFDALTRAEIPVEIVGLKGLLRLPEVAEVVATLTLLHDLTANAELLTLLSGPRWAVGTRDLALLGARARHMARGPGARQEGLSIADELAAAVEGADPTEVPALSDALHDPGDADYSPEALERFGLLAGELSYLRGFAAEPLLDLVRRIIDVTGIDVELASSVNPAAHARRDNLDLFVKAVAEFQAVDGDVSLPALLGLPPGEDELRVGLDVATPTDADSVKLLTVHRAKGLEWNAVFLVGVCDGKFPSGSTRTSGPPGRACCRPRCAATGAAPPGLAVPRRPTCTRRRPRSGPMADRGACRSATSPSPGRGTSWWCRPTAATPTARARSARRLPRPSVTPWPAGGWSRSCWLDKPDKTAVNPLSERVVSAPWPAEGHSRRDRAPAGGRPAGP